MSSVSETLSERAKTYGDFRDIAKISGALQRTMRATRNWDALPEDAREALQTIASKIARILNGDPEFVDSWHDIAGYATLVENRLRESEAKIDAAVRQHCVPAPLPLAIPPDGFSTQYDPRYDSDKQPWYAKRTAGNITVHGRGATPDEALDAAQKAG